VKFSYCWALLQRPELWALRSELRLRANHIIGAYGALPDW